MLALLVALGGVAFFATDKLYRTSEDRYVKEVFPLRSYTRDVILQMLNEETGVRGYLITADRANLQPYAQAKPLVVEDLAGLERLTARRPEIAGDVVELRRLVRELDGYFRGEIALVASGPAGQRQAQQNLSDGKARFDRFRAVAGSLLNRSERIVVGAERSQHRTFVSTLAVVLAMGGVAIAIGIGLLLFLPRQLGVLYRRERDGRRAAERGDRASRALTHVDDAVVLLDPVDAIRYWNPAAVATFGVSEEHALGRPAQEVMPC